MNAPVVPAMPSFADLQSQYGQQPSIPNAPSGGANPPPTPASQPGVGGLPPVQPTPQPPASYLAELERDGRIPAGQFKTERDLIDALYGTASELATQVEQYQKKPMEPVAPSAPEAPVAPVADLTKMATVFQQNGWLSLQNGQWVANNAMATEVASQMNNSILEAQARQAELADPSAFISKYGADVITKAMTPLQQELAALKQQNEYLQQQFAASAPRPDKTWVETNREKLFTKNTAGTEVHTPAGKAYSEAWEMARQAGRTDINEIHQYALTVATPYLTQMQAPPTPAPAQSWMQQATATPRHDPSFSAPGTILNSSVPPSGIGIPVGNDGFPTFQSLQALGLQGQ